MSQSPTPSDRLHRSVFSPHWFWSAELPFSPEAMMSHSDLPFLATAIHDGHQLRAELRELTALSDQQRLYEEDPYTGYFARMCETHFIPITSRFEVDLNRSREKAVYQSPDDCWGLTAWKQKLNPQLVERSLKEYDDFYDSLEQQLRSLISEHGLVVVFDLHSYNHRRSGPQGPVDDPRDNPEINLGTGSMNRARWNGVVESFLDGLRRFNFLGWTLDARENIRFQGGHLSQWIHENYPDNACCLAVEVKKFFMDEWTGSVDATQLHAVRNALESTLPGIRRSLDRMSMQR